jgi:hypothetical protein
VPLENRKLDVNTMPLENRKPPENREPPDQKHEIF